MGLSKTEKESISRLIIVSILKDMLKKDLFTDEETIKLQNLYLNDKVDQIYQNKKVNNYIEHKKEYDPYFMRKVMNNTKGKKH
jgi:hypothetical protein